MDSIAEAHGFFPGTLWDLPENAELRSLRGDPDVLAPGDEVYVPERRPHSEQLPVDQRHRFKIKGVPSQLRLQVVVGGELRADQPYTLQVSGVSYEGVTDGEGVLEQAVPPQARSAILVIGPDDFTFELSLGTVDPLSTVAGVHHRLTNLGYDCGMICDRPTARLQACIRAFQARAGLSETGEWDDPDLQDALDTLHETTELLE